MLYLDTSVLAAYYCPEPLSRQVQDILSQQVKPALSFLSEVEFFSAVARKVRMEELEMAAGNRILAKFQSHLDGELFTVISVQNHHWRLARGWIGLFNTPLRTLDALHLAIASAEDLELVTSDKHLYHSAEILGVRAGLVK
jgi:hypothetical protein